MFVKVCEDEKNIEYHDGDEIFIVDIALSHALFDVSGCVSRNKACDYIGGRIGHSKNYTLDRAIEVLEMLKDKDI